MLVVIVIVCPIAKRLNTKVDKKCGEGMRIEKRERISLVAGKIRLSRPLLLHLSCPDHTKLSVRYLAVKLLGIMLRNRWWPTTCLTITVGDANGWCQN